MHGYLIIQLIVQIMDVTHQIQVTGDIGQVHQKKTIQLRRGASIEVAT